MIIPSLSNDEADLYLSSYLVAKSGSDYYGNKLFLTSGILTAKPSIPIYIGSLTWLFHQEKNVNTARLLFALINSLTPVIFFITIYLITRSYKYSLASFLILNFSPWFSYSSVTGYESVISFLFLNISLLLSVSNIKKPYKFIMLFISLSLVFNSYMAIRTYMPLVVAIVLFMGNFFKYTKFIKTSLYLISVGFLLTFLFTFVNYYSPNSELVKKEFKYLLSYDNKQDEGKIWYERLTTNASTDFKRLLVNKATVQIHEYTEKYLSILDTNIFFIKGDPSSLYGTAGLIGLFYLSDFGLFIFGIVNLKNIEKKLLALLGFFIIGTIPVALTKTDVTIILRAIVLLIPFTLIIAHGAISFTKKSRYASVILLIILVINWISFLLIYNTRIAPLNQSAWQMNEKNLIAKIDKLDKKMKIIIYQSEPRTAFIQYAFYKISDPLVIKSRLQQEKYNYLNVEYKNACPKIINQKNEIYIMKLNSCADFYKSTSSQAIGTSLIKIDKKFLINSDFSGDDYILFMRKD